ncbi:hypothetical protein [Bacteroides stercoris]|uniref:hypothetical protein n=1 Tax=Bacteroides stercoris TaxID=46506 RepID=UPI001896BEEE|nr:hypothetical protein [Bacteroides stercoris]
MSSELVIIKQENIQTIVYAAPQSYSDNKLSCERCISAGQSILNAITTNGGMTDELDKEVALFIEKARKTVKKMNEKRSPVTKLFDDIRREFTVIENAIDPTKVDTIPYKLQQYRNQYAAKKRAEEEKRRQEEYKRQQAEQARVKLKQDIEGDFKAQFQTYLNQSINWLTTKDNSVTLENYNTVYSEIKNFSVSLPADWLHNLHTLIRIPGNVSVDELRQFETDIKERLGKQFTDQYTAEIQDNKDFILDRLPSKKANLERMAQADAAEAARVKAEIEERQRKEAEAREAERKRKEEEEKQKAEMERQQAEMNGLFSEQASMQNYQPKVKVTQKIELLNPEGIMPILSMWWSKEGCTLSVEELSKLFKKQITFCEKLANKDSVYIENESVQYIDDVKAK